MKNERPRYSGKEDACNHLHILKDIPFTKEAIYLVILEHFLKARFKKSI